MRNRWTLKPKMRAFSFLITVFLVAVANQFSAACDDDPAAVNALKAIKAELKFDKEGAHMVLARVRGSLERMLQPERLGIWTDWGLDFEALSKGLQGGRLPAGQGLSHIRDEAERLLRLLCLIQPESLSCFKTIVEQDHGSARKWGEQALRIPGWSRERWVSPLLALIQRTNGMDRRLAAMHLRDLGAAAASAVPTLMELARREFDDQEYQYDLTLVLGGLGTILGVPLLDQIPRNRDR